MYAPEEFAGRAKRGSTCGVLLPDDSDNEE